MLTHKGLTLSPSPTLVLFFLHFLLGIPEVKISIDHLVNCENSPEFYRETGINHQQLERYISGQFSKFFRLRANVFSLHDTHKISDVEFKEIVDFCDKNLQKCEAIAQNFDLFKNVKTANPSYSEYNRRVKSLLGK